jgi:putative peptide zinc metalloprotease protein
VGQDDVLARLNNIDVEIAIAKAAGQHDVYEAQLKGLERSSFRDRSASAQIKQVREGRDSAKKQLEKLEVDKAKLQLVAPQAGTVLPPPIADNQRGAATNLPSWSGSPFDRENRGATLLKGTKFCQVGDPNRLEARLLIDEGDIDFVEVGQRVEIMLAQSAEYVYVSKIESKANDYVKESPTHLSSLTGGPLPTKMSNSGVAEPLSRVFEALVPLPEEDPHGLLRIGLIGRAKISTGPRTLFDRLWRYVARTFNFEL